MGGRCTNAADSVRLRDSATGIAAFSDADIATSAKSMWPDTYTDIGERFFGSDGSFHFEMWSLAPPSIGIQTLAFEIWADVLQPWLD